MKLAFRPLTVSIALAFLSVAPVRALALGMSPMYMELAAGGKTSAQFQFSNPSQTSAAVEIKIETLTYDEAGNRRTTPDGGNLIVVPPVAVVAPGSTQTFRVQWVGSANIARSQTFLITARQLPVKLPQDGGSRIQMVQAFGALLTVAPVGGTSHLQLVSSQPTHLQGKPAVSAPPPHSRQLPHRCLPCRALIFGELQPGGRLGHASIDALPTDWPALSAAGQTRRAQRHAPGCACPVRSWRSWSQLPHGRWPPPPVCGATIHERLRSPQSLIRVATSISTGRSNALFYVANTLYLGWRFRACNQVPKYCSYFFLIASICPSSRAGSV